MPAFLGKAAAVMLVALGASAAPAQVAAQNGARVTIQPGTAPADPPRQVHPTGGAMAHAPPTRPPAPPPHPAPQRVIPGQTANPPATQPANPPATPASQPTTLPAATL